MTAEEGVLQGLQKSVDALATSAEYLAFNAANTGLKIAQANTKDLDLARSVVHLADDAADAVLDASAWVTAHTFNTLNLKSVELSGDLRGLLKNSTEFKAHVVGTFAEQSIDFSVDFTPGQGEKLAEQVFQKLMADAKSGVLKILR